MSALTSPRSTSLAPAFTCGRNLSRWLPGGVLYMSIDHVVGDLIYDVQDAEDGLQLVEEMLTRFPSEVGEQGVPIIADMSNVRRTSPQARRTQAHPRTAKIGLVVGTPVSRILGSAYLGIVRPKVPTKLFDDVASAYTWLVDGELAPEIIVGLKQGVRP